MARNGPPTHARAREAMGREVKLKDLAVVCANCHAMIHIGGKCRPLAVVNPNVGG